MRSAPRPRHAVGEELQRRSNRAVPRRAERRWASASGAVAGRSSGYRPASPLRIPSPPSGLPVPLLELCRPALNKLADPTRDLGHTSPQARDDLGLDRRPPRPASLARRGARARKLP
ncbi:unnamed protein product [Urochloa humidicola]